MSVKPDQAQSSWLAGTAARQADADITASKAGASPAWPAVTAKASGRAAPSADRGGLGAQLSAGPSGSVIGRLTGAGRAVTFRGPPRGSWSWVRHDLRPMSIMIEKVVSLGRRRWLTADQGHDRSSTLCDGQAFVTWMPAR